MQMPLSEPCDWKGFMNYVNFDLVVTEDDHGEAYVQLIKAPNGEETKQPLLFELPDDIRNTWERARDSKRPGEFPCETMGKALYRALFVQPIDGIWRRCCNKYADPTRRALRLRLDIRSARLAALPWEAMYQDDFPLATSRTTPIVRFNSAVGPAEIKGRDNQLNILVAIARPQDQKALRASFDELSAISDNFEKWLGSVRTGGRLDLCDHATLEKLDDKLSASRYEILHFIGHGDFSKEQDKGYLLLEDRFGKTNPVDGKILGIILKEAGLRLLFLNACETAGPALMDPMYSVAYGALSAGVPAVIAMQGPVDDVLAAYFAEKFYAAIASGYPVETAVAKARLKLLASKGSVDNPAWIVPVFYSNVPKELLLGSPPPSEDKSGRVVPDFSDANEAPRVYHRAMRGVSSREVVHNLSRPDYRRLVGREKELGDILNILEPEDRTAIINIYGVTGSGRSALALEAALRCYDFSRRYSDNPRAFEAIICTSTQRPTITCDGDILWDKAGLWNFETLFINIVRTTNNEKFLQLRDDERLATLQNLLSEGRYLLILNDVDEVDSVRVKELLRSLPIPTKAIVTSCNRLDIYAHAHPIPLAGLDRDAALQLVREDAHRHQLTLFNSPDPSEFNQLLNCTGGLPFALRWSVTQLATTDRPLSWFIQHLANADLEQLARYCLQKTMEDLRHPEREILRILSLLPQPACHGSISEIAGIGDTELGRSLTRLSHLRLLRLNEVTRRYSITLLARKYTLKELGQDLSSADRLASMAVRQVYRQVEEDAGWRADPAAAESLEAELGNITWAVQQAYNLNDWQLVLDFWKPTAFDKPLQDFLFRRGYYNEALLIGRVVFDAASQLGEERAKAWSALYPIARMYFYQGNYEEAQRWCRISLSIFKTFDNADITDGDISSDIAAAERYMGRILQHMGELGESEEYFKKGLERALRLDRTKFARLQGNLYASVAGLAEEREHYDHALVNYAEALKLYEAAHDDDGRAATLLRLGTISLAQGKYDEAESRLAEGLQIVKGWREREANMIYAQGLLAEKRGQLNEAERLLSQVRQTFSDLLLAPDLRRAEAALDRVTAMLGSSKNQRDAA
jgi:tetratricopeptide (TPR) repeat protein